MKQNVNENETDQWTMISIWITTNQRRALQKAWQRTGEYCNRSQWVKAALNAFAKEEIFP